MKLPEPQPVRLDQRVIQELSEGNTVLPAVMNNVHEYCDFFLRAAALPFASPTPEALHAAGAHPARISMARFHLFHRVLILRAATLLEGAVRSLNDSRLLEFALAARGVLETAAVGAYHAPRLAIAPDVSTLPDNFDMNARQAVMGSRFDWLKYTTDYPARLALIDEYDAASDLSKVRPPDSAKNILTMLEALARRLAAEVPKARGIMFLDYALLSDVCHPAAGSYLLFLTEIEPKWRAELVPRRQTTLGIAAQILPCVGYSALALISVLAELEVVEEQLERLATPAGPGPVPDR